MKRFASCFAALALAACSSSSNNPDAGTTSTATATAGNGSATATNGTATATNGNGTTSTASNGTATATTGNGTSATATATNGTATATAGNGSSTATTGTATAGNGTTATATATNGTATATAGTATAGNGTSGSGTTGTGTTGGTITAGAGTTTGGTGASCTRTQGGTDPCVASGYQCNATQYGVAGICVLPTVNGECLTTVGCNQTDAGPPQLECSPGFQTGQAVPIDLCVYPCTTSTACQDPTSTCIAVTQGGNPSVCFNDYCNLSDAGTFSFVPPFYDTCDAAGTGDGQCLSSFGGTEALCYQVGTLATGATCDYNRGGAVGECVAGDICVPGVTTTGQCFPIGDISDGGSKPCGQNQVAIGIIGNADWAACTTFCDGGAGSCPSPQACQALQGGSTYACLAP